MIFRVAYLHLKAAILWLNNTLQCKQLTPQAAISLYGFHIHFLWWHCCQCYYYYPIFVSGKTPRDPEEATTRREENTRKGRLHRDWKSTEPFHSCTKGKNKMVLWCWFFAFVFVLGFFFVSLLFFFCFCFLLGKNSWTIATKHHGGLISWSFSWSNFSALPSKQATNIRVLRFCTECIVF